ncbi:pyridoxamine 5'-phosphate oxidase family protein [Microbacterium invictum]|uniref:Pyridoxamine 5'-phosphate oxidase family protein n=1 Tax=Microbacterium invictum TaxID=515415 RepID=A0ABZ0VG46_9MICO|nr:pyridoxamine 5'-phosphate oxidase family protein [Microbacterium invictum]WQB71626.1 pyridoxamine 5'-phosphate oxidase family protein [Microbacterium invictum]
MAELFTPGDPVHEKAQHLLDSELIAWFTTVGEDGTPHAVPVWFFWHDGAVWILTRPDSVKARQVRRGSRALVHLNTQGRFGADVVVLSGSARIIDQSAAEWLITVREPWTEKYVEAIEDFGMPVDELVQQFEAVIRMEPEKLLAW